MKPKNKIKKLKKVISKLKDQLQTDRIILIDKSNPNLKAVISFENGDFMIHKITTTSTPELIFKDNK